MKVRATRRPDAKKMKDTIDECYYFCQIFFSFKLRCF